MEVMIKKVDFSNYKIIFCDSLEALNWAYQNGLPKSAIVKSSSPAMLWDKKKTIENIEYEWTTFKREKFQEEIQQLTEQVFDSIISIPESDRELALCITDVVYRFQNIIYKAACLNESDYREPRLLIYVDGKTGPHGNIMNSPWSQLLSSNPLFLVEKYTLKNDNWTQQNTEGVSYWNRFKLAGYETIIYRLSKKIMKVLPAFLFKRELIMPNENELNIEIAASLALRGVRIRDLKIDESRLIRDNSKVNFSSLYEVVLPIVNNRIERWVAPSAAKITMSIFNSHLQEQLTKFYGFVDKFENKIYKSNKKKQYVLMNAPGNIKGFALANVCKKHRIPILSSQHGVTVEISKKHNIARYEHDNSVANVMFSYNKKIIQVENNTHFNNSKHYCVGMPLRLMRVKYLNQSNKPTPPIVFISTNLYNRGFSLSGYTDYQRARNEQTLINEVWSKLPHKVCYKTYPEDNRRYADRDPVFSDVNKAKNMELFSKKIDMRYLISNFKILVTTSATSTIGWPVMSNKPVVFINQEKHMPLTNDAYLSFSKGLFVFNDYEKDFYKDLRDFLSLPLNEIERLWVEKQKDREDMIKNYFSFYADGKAGKRASQIILEEFMA
jgi:hypothetical protein